MTNIKLPKVSVIIPVYNVEKYIEQCVRSLFEQTLDDIEYIFLDDCTPDRSIEIVKKVLNEYPDRVPLVKIIKNEQNIGVGQTRQKGIDIASGAYIIHCDPDDWVDSDLYEKMWECAIKNHADIVICDYMYEWENRSRIAPQEYPNNKRAIFKGIAFEKFHTGLCTKLVKSDLAKKYRIKSGINMWEDMTIGTMILLSANNIIHIDTPFYYHYRKDHNDSIVHDKSLKNIQSRINAVIYLKQQLISNQFDKEIDPLDMDLLCWTAAFPLLKSLDIKDYKLWSNTFQEENKSFRSFDSIRFRSKLLTWLGLHKCYRSIKLINLIQRKLR